MSEVTRLYPVTRIRGELQPSPAVERAVNRFLENPVEPGVMRLYTTAQAIVDQDEYRHHRYDTALRVVEQEHQQKGVRSLAQRAIALAAPLKIFEAPNGSGRLFFNVHPQDKPALRQLRYSLGAIEGLEEPDDEDLLYVEFARGALAADRERRHAQMVEGRDLIAAELRHPTAKFRMTATGFHIVTRDIMYPLKGDQTLPLAE